MCGIVGIYFKKKKLYNKLGKYLSGMLDNMSSRGPDSAGFAIYNNESKKYFKYSLCINDKSIINNFQDDVIKKFKDVSIKSVSDHLVIKTHPEESISLDRVEMSTRATLDLLCPGLHSFLSTHH